MKIATKKGLTKKRGRPATGRHPIVGVRLPKETIARVDAWGEKRGILRSEAIRELIERGLSKRT
jgi:hypothetical protein